MLEQLVQSKRIPGRNESLRSAPISTRPNHKATFTAKQALCFLRLNGLVKVEKVTDAITDDQLNWILKSSGFTRPRVDDSMVQAAFKSLAPSLPKIPPDNIMRILEFSKANKLAAAYKIDNKVSWSTLKNDLCAKRLEIMEAYGTYLVSGGAITEHTVEQTRPVSSSRPTTLRGCTVKVDVHCLESKRRSLYSGNRPTECPSPSLASPKKLDEDHCSLPKGKKEASADWTRYRDSEAGRSKIPCYVTTRRKEVSKRQEVQQNKRNGAVKSGEYEPIPISGEGKGSPRKGGESGQPGNGFIRYERASISSDILDALQLARSPEICNVPEDSGFPDEDDWVDDTPPPVKSLVLEEISPISEPKESPTTRTLRKLAEWRDRVIEEQRTGVWQEKQRKWQQRDFMNSPDSDFSFSEACRSPRQRSQCTFAFRGLHIDAPAAPEKPSRSLHPLWCEREDAGSPTPVGIGRYRMQRG